MSPGQHMSVEDFLSTSGIERPIRSSPGERMSVGEFLGGQGAFGGQVLPPDLEAAVVAWLANPAGDIRLPPAAVGVPLIRNAVADRLEQEIPDADPIALRPRILMQIALLREAPAAPAGAGPLGMSRSVTIAVVVVVGIAALLLVMLLVRRRKGARRKGRDARG